MFIDNDALLVNPLLIFSGNKIWAKDGFVKNPLSWLGECNKCLAVC